MRIYFINLERHPERLTHMQALLQCFDFERVNAIDARLWPQTEARLSRFERACVQSHRSAWTRFLQSTEPLACFLEDDVHLSKEFSKFISDNTWIPADAHAVKLDTYFNTVMLDHQFTMLGKHRLARLHTRHESCAGYILSRRGAECFLEGTENPNLPLDYIVFPEEPCKQRLYLYQLVPAVVIQDSLYLKLYGRSNNFGSSIQGIDAGKPKHKGRAIVYKLKRESVRLCKQTVKAKNYLYKRVVLGLKPEVIPFS